MSEQTLYERVGGEEGIASLVEAFYERIQADARLAPFFKDTSMEKLHRMQREFFSAALGGDAEYSGVELSYAHQGLGITREDLARFVDHLFETLKAIGCEVEDARAVIARINTYSDAILGGSGGVGG